MSNLATINYQQCTFFQSAELFSQCPHDIGTEVAFAGRSNAGKSSVINALTQQKKLARVSKTPGRTQLINFFNLNEDQRLVDLPGYGYAKVPLAMRAQWENELEQYFQYRESLKGLVIIMDVRHPLQNFDEGMLHFAESRKLPCHVLLNKADKFKFGAAKNQLMKVSQQLRKRPGQHSVQLFSAMQKTGLDELKEKLDAWLHLDETPED